MTEQRLNIGLVVERRLISSVWADHVWLPITILSPAPDVTPWTSLGSSITGDMFYIGETEIIINALETGRYRDNLLLEQPLIWVGLRNTGVPDPAVEIAGVTLDPAEGEMFTEGMADIVETVPMPTDIAALLAAFCETYHVERAFFKRQRDRANPDAFSHRPPGTAHEVGYDKGSGKDKMT